MRRKAWNNYKDPVSGWSMTTKGWSYGRKYHMAIDVDSLIIMEWLVTKGNMYDSHMSSLIQWVLISQSVSCMRLHHQNIP